MRMIGQVKQFNMNTYEVSVQIGEQDVVIEIEAATMHDAITAIREQVKEQYEEKPEIWFQDMKII